MAADAILTAMHGVCIVGLGGYAHVHARELQRSKRARLFFSSRDAAKAQDFAGKYEGEAAGPLDEVLKRKEISAVVLCGPHDLHVKEARAALAAGKSVLLEKPVARTSAEARRILAALKPGGARFMLAENFAFLPHLPILSDALSRIGPPKKFLVRHWRRYRPVGWRLKLEQMGGGLLIDMGVHHLRLLHLLFGLPSRVRCLDLRRGIEGMEGESEIAVELEYESGVHGRLELSWQRDIEPWDDRFEAEGALGRLATSLTGKEVRLELGGKTEILPVPQKDPRGHAALIHAFLDCLDGGDPLVTAENGIQDLLVVERAYASAASAGKWK